MLISYANEYVTCSYKLLVIYVIIQSLQDMKGKRRVNEENPETPPANTPQVPFPYVCF